jgi:hypothetical protein
MRRVLRPGGVIGIADADHGAMLREPHMPLVDRAHRLLLEVITHNGGDPFRARHHRGLLREAGFVGVVGGATTETVGVWGTAEETREFAAWESGQLRQPAVVEVLAGQGLADRATIEAMAEALVAWGEHPDALFALIGVTAVGWVPE